MGIQDTHSAKDKLTIYFIHVFFFFFFFFLGGGGELRVSKYSFLCVVLLTIYIYFLHLLLTSFKPLKHKVCTFLCSTTINGFTIGSGMTSTVKKVLSCRKLLVCSVLKTCMPLKYEFRENREIWSWTTEPIPVISCKVNIFLIRKFIVLM